MRNSTARLGVAPHFRGALVNQDWGFEVEFVPYLKLPRLLDKLRGTEA
jgi:hypothetical protein